MRTVCRQFLVGFFSSLTSNRDSQKVRCVYQRLSLVLIRVSLPITFSMCTTIWCRNPNNEQINRDYEYGSTDADVQKIRLYFMEIETIKCKG